MKYTFLLIFLLASIGSLLVYYNKEDEIQGEETHLDNVAEDFLNNQQNYKNHPNENFAREVMELFTMGRGNYTEDDVKEAARAFTGWGFDPQGEFIFRDRQHDDGIKTFSQSFGARPMLALRIALPGSRVTRTELDQSNDCRLVKEPIRILVPGSPDG